MKLLIICILTFLTAELSHSQTLFCKTDNNVLIPQPRDQEGFFNHHRRSVKSHTKSRLNSYNLLRLDSIITYTPSGQIHSLYQWIYSEDIIPSERIFFNYKDDKTPIPASKRIKLYDQDNLLSTEYYVEWLLDQQEWDTLTKEDYYYDNTGTLVKVQSYLAPDWYLYLQRIYTYSSSGVPESETIYREPDSEPAFKIEYSHQNDLLYRENTYEWSSGDWLPIHQILYTNDEYGNPVEQLFSHRELSSGNELVPYKKSLLTYDLSVAKETLIMDTGFPFRHKLAEITDLEYQKSTNEWILTKTSMPYYSEVNNPVTDLQVISQNLFFDIYPNPFNNAITIATDSNSPSLLEVFCPLGTKVISNLIYNQQIISTEQLSAGVYICVLHTDNGFFFKRLIKND